MTAAAWPEVVDGSGETGLLYMHLDRLKKAGLVRGSLELSDDGKAMKYLELMPFDPRLTAETVVEALASDDGRLKALDTEKSDE